MPYYDVDLAAENVSSHNGFTQMWQPTFVVSHQIQGFIPRNKIQAFLLTNSSHIFLSCAILLTYLTSKVNSVSKRTFYSRFPSKLIIVLIFNSEIYIFHASFLPFIDCHTYLFYNLFPSSRHILSWSIFPFYSRFK